MSIFGIIRQEKGATYNDYLQRQPVTRYYLCGVPILTLKRKSRRKSRRRSVSRSVSGEGK